MTDVNPKVEAVYWHYKTVYAHDCDSIEEAVRFLESGEEEGRLSSVGVFVEGEPRRVESDRSLGSDYSDEQKLNDYAKVKMSGK